MASQTTTNYHKGVLLSNNYFAKTPLMLSLVGPDVKYIMLCSKYTLSTVYTTHKKEEGEVRSSFWNKKLTRSQGLNVKMYLPLQRA